MNKCPSISGLSEDTLSEIQLSNRHRKNLNSNEGKIEEMPDTPTLNKHINIVNSTDSNNNQFWKEMFISSIKNAEVYEETIKNLFEENRINQEYIIILEERLSDVLNKTNRITNSFHNNFKILQQSFSENNNNYNQELLQTIEDYKLQLDILAEEKDNLSSNLSLSRHQNLQSSIKLEELQKTLIHLKKSWINSN